MIRRQGGSRRRDTLEGCHPKPCVVVAEKIARCGKPVFAQIGVGRLMMQVGQKQDAMFLWRNLRKLELVGCSGSPCVEERRGKTWGGMSNRSTTEVDNEIWKAPENRRGEKKRDEKLTETSGPSRQHSL